MRFARSAADDARRRARRRYITTGGVEGYRNDLDRAGCFGHPVADNFHGITKVSATVQPGALVAS